MREQRIIGNNIQLLLKRNNCDDSMMASSLGYSKDDITRMREGRVFLSEKEIEEIASYFSISTKDLRKERASEEYEEAGCIHYNHHFKDQANLEEIMDLFDLICDIEEVL